jgi:hypothetical protein
MRLRSSSSRVLRSASSTISGVGLSGRSALRFSGASLRLVRSWRKPTSASITVGDSASRRTIARACASPCVRAIAISASSERQVEEVRKGAATAIGWLAMKKATAGGTVLH